MAALVAEANQTQGRTLPGFGNFKVSKTKARKGVNTRAGEPTELLSLPSDRL